MNALLTYDDPESEPAIGVISSCMTQLFELYLLRKPFLLGAFFCSKDWSEGLDRQHWRVVHRI